jgi:hypothetical protein
MKKLESRLELAGCLGFELRAFGSFGMDGDARLLVLSSRPVFTLPGTSSRSCCGDARSACWSLEVWMGRVVARSEEFALGQ